jgi:hypothetical protein
MNGGMDTEMPLGCMSKDLCEEVGMKYKLDIFQRFGNGQLFWVKAVEGQEEAHAELRVLQRDNPGEYFIYDTRTGRAIASAATAAS